MKESLGVKEQWIEIGTIIASHGLKGEVKVNSNSDFPERFQTPGPRWLICDHQSTPYTINLLKGYQVPGKNIYVVQLEGIKGREEADQLKGCKLLVPRDDLPFLAENEYHVCDLINLEVYHQQTGENIGFVTNLFSAGNDLLEVQLHKQPVIQEQITPNLSKINRKSKIKKVKPKSFKPVTILIPFVQEIVPIVDLENQKIYINPPQGLLNLESWEYDENC